MWSQFIKMVCLAAGGRVRAALQHLERRLILVPYFLEFPMVSFPAFSKSSVFNSLLLITLRKSCVYCTGMTLGTPIAVLVPNTDQRGGVSFSSIGGSI